MSSNDGGDTSYYDLPPQATIVMDLIEHQGMNFAQGEIFKAAYTLADDDARGHSDKVRDLNKIKWYVERELRRLEREV